MDTNEDARISRWAEDRLETLAPNPDWQPDTKGAFQRLAEAQVGRGRRRSWSLAFAGAAVVCLSVVAFPGTRVFAERCVVACVAQASRAGQFLRDGVLAPDRAATDVNRPGAMAPDFTRVGSSGKLVTLSSFRGKVVLLNFWATWCGPCAVEMPWFAEFQRTYQSEGFAVVGVSLDEDGWKSVRPFLEQRNVDYAVVVGDDELAGLYGNVNALPTTLIIDRFGRIASTHIGLVEKSEYEKAIQAALVPK